MLEKNKFGGFSPVVVSHEESLLASHKVLRNTYALLSVTLLFSAAMSALAMMVNAPSVPFIIHLAVLVGLVIATNRLRNSAWGLVAVFALTGFIGWTMGPMLNAYLKAFNNGGQLIAMAMGTTGAVFVSLSAYVLTTRKNFSFMGGFLFAGLIVMLLASLAVMFFNISGAVLAISVGMSLLMCGYILYDTSRIIHGGETNYISATVSLYLDIVILFQNLLSIFGIFSGDD